MTPEKINAAIAEFCRWKPLPDSDIRCEYCGCHICHCNEENTIPNYFGDLNAIHNVEKKLTPEQEETYVERLSALLMSDAYEDCPRFHKSHLSSSDSTYRATAPQRSEAMLRTIGRWEAS